MRTKKEKASLLSKDNKDYKKASSLLRSNEKIGDKNILSVNKGKLILSLLISLIFIFIILDLVYATDSSWPNTYNVCCEKTKDKAWCQNSLASNCDPSFRSDLTSCDSTSYCTPGCCIDPNEGICMQNTPEKVCEIGGGTWDSDSSCAISQCNLGCCMLGDQASFVTLTRCKKLSAVYGLQTNFKTGVPDEASCVLLVHSQDKGACVYEVDGDKTCKFTTMDECLNSNSSLASAKPVFKKDYLCSAALLGTNCGPSTKTGCIDGENEVYFLDTCGNRANIYDASRINDTSYWEKIVAKSDSCGAGSSDGNRGSNSCGNCDYFKGSICAKGVAKYGDFACKDLNCYNTQNGKNYKNGESWCVYQGNVGNGLDAVGSRHIRHICMDGEEIVEPCADFRNEICIQNELQTTDGNFNEAACRINRWQDCVNQDTQEKCLNTDQRDCYWTSGLGVSFVQTAVSQPNTATSSSSGSVATFQGNSVSGSSSAGSQKLVSGITLADGQDVCVPMIPPGLQFWNSGDASSVCSVGNSVCTVGYEKSGVSIVSDYIHDQVYDDNQSGRNKGTCVSNCDCLTESWVGKMNNVCKSLGDCGAYVNVAGKYTDDGAEWKIEGTNEKIQTGLMNYITNRGA